MNSPFDPHLPLVDPWEVCELSVHLPLWEAEFALDQQILEDVELSVQQPILLEEAAYADKICRTMDFIEEASVENRQSVRRFFLPDGVLDKLEADTESQVIRLEASGFEPPPEPVPEKFGSSESEPPLPDDGERFIKEYPLPPELSKGSQGTGSKCLNSNGTSMGWCQLHSKLVSSVDCEECDDNYGDSECEHWSDA